jgi:hypothetical protein
VTAGAQAKSVGTGSATGAGSGAGVTNSEEVQALLVDIFVLTGQKVQKDDPLVAAALIHSALLRRAGEDAARAIALAAQSARQDTETGQWRARELQSAIGWLAPWQAKAALGAVLFLICLLASALGGLLAASTCR